MALSELPVLKKWVGQREHAATESMAPEMSNRAQGRIEALGDETGGWDAFVHSHGNATQCHLASWRNIIEAVFGHETYYLQAVAPNGKVRGVMPLVRLRSRLFGDFLVSVPYVNYGGALGVDADVEQQLMREACALACRLEVDHVEFRDTMPRDHSWAVRTDKVCMEMALPRSVEALDKGLGSKLRAQIKRPLREGATVEDGGDELCQDFYAVFARNMRDLGTPVYDRKLFESVLKTFGQAARVIIVRLKGEPVAAGIVIRHRERMDIPWASSLKEYNRYGVNMLLYRRCLELAIEQGCSVFDFGRSTRESGTYRFKAQWGATPKQLYWHYWLRRGGSPPRLNADNPRYRLAVRLWSCLPLGIANTLGPHVVKNLP